MGDLTIQRQDMSCSYKWKIWELEIKEFLKMMK